jgi:hypothetical protein
MPCAEPARPGGPHERRVSDRAEVALGGQPHGRLRLADPSPGPATACAPTSFQQVPIMTPAMSAALRARSSCLREGTVTAKEAP